jgi:hypothetical protein
MLDEVTMRVAYSMEDWRCVQLLRTAIDLPVELGSPDWRSLEMERDSISVTFLFFLAEEVVGTLRLVPLSSGLAPSGPTLKAWSVEPELLEKGCEISRLVMDTDSHNSSVLKQCLRLAFEYTKKWTSFENGFAVCQHRLARLYRKYGAAVMVPNAWPLPNGPYALVHCNLASIAEALKD